MTNRVTAFHCSIWFDCFRFRKLDFCPIIPVFSHTLQMCAQANSSHSCSLPFYDSVHLFEWLSLSNSCGWKNERSERCTIQHSFTHKNSTTPLDWKWIVGFIGEKIMWWCKSKITTATGRNKVVRENEKNTCQRKMMMMMDRVENLLMEAKYFPECWGNEKNESRVWQTVCTDFAFKCLSQLIIAVYSTFFPFAFLLTPCQLLTYTPHSVRWWQGVQARRWWWGVIC